MTDEPQPAPAEPEVTPYHEGATEIGLAYIVRYLPVGTTMPMPPPDAVMELANEIGHVLLARYDNPQTPEEETPVPPGETGPFNLEAKVQEAIAAIPPAPPQPTFMERQKQMLDELAAQAAPLTPEQQAAMELDKVRYTPPPAGPTMAEQMEKLNLEPAPELTPEQQAEAERIAQRYQPPAPPPTFIEQKLAVEAQLEAQREADMKALYGTPSEPATSSPPPSPAA